MAACSVFSSYPTTSQPSTYASRNLLDVSDRGRRGSSSGAGGFIRDDIMFTPPRCSTPSSMPRSPGPRSGEYLGTSGPGVAHVDRRAALLQDYFKSTNALNRSIMLEKSTVENQHGHSWTILSDSKRDEIVDEHFVPSQVRDQYDERGLTASFGRSRTLSRLGSNPMNGFLSQKTHHYEDIVSAHIIAIMHYYYSKSIILNCMYTYIHYWLHAQHEKALYTYNAICNDVHIPQVHVIGYSIVVTDSSGVHIPPIHSYYKK